MIGTSIFSLLEPTRREQVQFLLTLDKARIDKFQREIDLILSSQGLETPNCCECDKLKLTYSIMLYYFGKVTQCLEALGTILSDPDVVLSAELDELIHGECLLVQILDRLRHVQEIIKQRQAGREGAA